MSLRLWQWKVEAYLEPNRRSKMEPICESRWLFSQKCFIVDIRLSSKYVSRKNGLQPHC